MALKIGINGFGRIGRMVLRSIIENILLKIMFDLPGQNNIAEVIIDLGAAKGKSEPLIVHAKQPKNKSEKKSFL